MRNTQEVHENVWICQKSNFLVVSHVAPGCTLAWSRTLLWKMYSNQDNLRRSVEEFLSDLEPELVKYATSLRDLGFTSANMLRFLKLKDLENIPCAIPAPHRRMILSAVAKLQSPESKACQIESPSSEELIRKRRKTAKENLTTAGIASCETSTSSFEPRTLFPEKGAATGNSAYDILLGEKMKLEKEHTKCKAELSVFLSQPTQLMSLSIPGSRITSTMCTRCHHRGHRKEGNKNGCPCQFEACVGYHYCGNERLHPEFKTEKRDVSRIISVELFYLFRSWFAKNKYFLYTMVSAVVFLILQQINIGHSQFLILYLYYM